MCAHQLQHTYSQHQEAPVIQQQEQQQQQPQQQPINQTNKQQQQQPQQQPINQSNKQQQQPINQTNKQQQQTITAPSHGAPSQQHVTGPSSRAISSSLAVSASPAGALAGNAWEQRERELGRQLELVQQSLRGQNSKQAEMSSRLLLAERQRRARELLLLRQSQNHSQMFNKLAAQSKMEAEAAEACSLQRQALMAMQMSFAVPAAGAVAGLRDASDQAQLRAVLVQKSVQDLHHLHQAIGRRFAELESLEVLDAPGVALENRQMVAGQLVQTLSHSNTASTSASSAPGRVRHGIALTDPELCLETLEDEDREFRTEFKVLQQSLATQQVQAQLLHSEISEAVAEESTLQEAELRLLVSSRGCDAELRELREELAAAEARSAQLLTLLEGPRRPS
ncbi:unnamed protein product [Polarella glacialis]|uniref:Uncharacterized protein n=1 Tax=Polarella glacialis TaxID=89957 RepID=A0A813FD03_POLGL|nr:unnamed protein product [Polarella glacialis]